VATIKDLGGNDYGEMATWTGTKVDWLVKSWLGDPFDLVLTVWITYTPFVVTGLKQAHMYVL